MTRSKSISTQSKSVKAFLETANKIPIASENTAKGRLVFAMDATASREHCWDVACQIQSEMFTETAVLGQLLIQLCYFHGYGEFYSTNWTNNSTQLQKIMSAVRCKSGQTQIHKIFEHALEQSKTNKINAVVYVGDCMEETADSLYKQAGQLALRGIPVFIFHEGYEPIAEKTFRHIARLTKGAYCRFDQSSPDQLKNLLKAVAVYAVGGLNALKNQADSSILNNEIIKQLTDQS